MQKNKTYTHLILVVFEETLLDALILDRNDPLLRQVLILLHRLFAEPFTTLLPWGHYK